MGSGGGGSFTVALVGRRVPDNENLGLGYLRAALRDAGVRVEAHYWAGGRDVARIAEALLARPPGLVGLSLADGGSAFLPLALGRLLRRRGFTGHITCGGPFATLARRWLLERYEWLDGVVRFAGERPLRELALRLAAGESVEGVPGLTARRGDGVPAPVLDDLPLRLRPERDELPRILGHAAAHMAASRGCAGRCLYCGPAAIQAQERAEGVRAGAAPADLDRCGVGGLRRRDVDHLCDEMAWLWRERDVRYFYFVDEHLLPYDEAEALGYLRGWRDGLARRRVGPFGIGTMLRADRLTPAVAGAFADLGLVRVFVGLELAGEAEARRFGRRAPGERELDLLRTFARRGVVTVSNLMLVHPYSTPESVAAGIDLLERIPAGLFEATRMNAYHGTRLWRRVAAEGRLCGNPLRWGYRLEDPVVERFDGIFSRLRAQAFRDYSVAFRTHDAHLALALSRRLEPDAPRAGVAARLERCRSRVNALYVDAYRRALTLAREGGGFAEAGPLVREMRARAREIEQTLQEAEDALLRPLPGPARLFAPMRAAAAGSIAFCLLGAPAGGCGGPGAAADAGPEIDVEAGAEADADAGPDDGCTEAEQAAALDRVRRIASAADPCFSGFISFHGDPPAATASSWLSAQVGTGLEELLPCGDASRLLVDASERRVEEALAGRSFPCLPRRPDVRVDTGAQEDLERMAAADVRTCGTGGEWPEGFVVVVDGEGRVVEVRGGSGDPWLTEVAECIRYVLEGMVFPCLAGFEVCPEFAVIE